MLIMVVKMKVMMMDGWLKDGGRWLKDGEDDDWDGVRWGVSITDRRTDRITNIGECRVAFATENGKKL